MYRRWVRIETAVFQIGTRQFQDVPKGRLPTIVVMCANYEPVLRLERLKQFFDVEGSRLVACPMKPGQGIWRLSLERNQVQEQHLRGETFGLVSMA